MGRSPDSEAALETVRSQLAEAVAARKCHTCGCLHKTVDALEQTASGQQLLGPDLKRARDVFAPMKYDCLGCAVCFPALAANAFTEAFPREGAALDLCPTDAPEERTEWPPLPGDYQVTRYAAPVAVCALNSESLVRELGTHPPDGLSIVGTLHTENLGIERLIRNVLANPNIRRLVVCGADTQQAIGHLPGQSLVSLLEHGMDEVGRIRGARGRRPVLKNVSRAQVDAFGRQVALVPLIGETEAQVIRRAVIEQATTAPRPFAEAAADVAVAVTPAAEPKRLTPDPAGYCVVYPDRARRRLRVEHFQNTGTMDAVVEGTTPAALYATLIERGLISRLDHAAYLGRELARAERALAFDEPYVQDRAAGEINVLEPAPSCGCGSECSPKEPVP